MKGNHVGGWCGFRGKRFRKTRCFVLTRCYMPLVNVILVLLLETPSLGGARAIVDSMALMGSLMIASVFTMATSVEFEEYMKARARWGGNSTEDWMAGSAPWGMASQDNTTINYYYKTTAEDVCGHGDDPYDACIQNDSAEAAVPTADKWSEFAEECHELGSHGRRCRERPGCCKWHVMQIAAYKAGFNFIYTWGHATGELAAVIISCVALRIYFEFSRDDVLLDAFPQKWFMLRLIVLLLVGVLIAGTVDTLKALNRLLWIKAPDEGWSGLAGSALEGSDYSTPGYNIKVMRRWILYIGFACSVLLSAGLSVRNYVLRSDMLGVLRVVPDGCELDHLEMWSAAQVRQYLCNLNKAMLSGHASRFEEHQVAGCSLRYLRLEDLQEMSIPIGHRALLLEECRKLCAMAANAANMLTSSDIAPTTSGSRLSPDPFEERHSLPSENPGSSFEPTVPAMPAEHLARNGNCSVQRIDEISATIEDVSRRLGRLEHDIRVFTFSAHPSKQQPVVVTEETQRSKARCSDIPMLE